MLRRNLIRRFKEAVIKVILRNREKAAAETSKLQYLVENIRRHLQKEWVS